MKKMNVHEAKSKLSALLAELEEGGEPITICRNGVPVAQLTRVLKLKRNPLEQNQKLKGIKFIEDPTKPLSEDEWPEELR